MKYRLLSICLICVILVCVLPLQSSAVENTYIITYEDGSHIEISITESSMRASNVQSGQKIHRYYDSSGNLDWEAVLTASFTYNGTTSSCTSASCTLTIYDSAWYQVSKSTTRSGNTATTVLTMGQKVLGVTISKPSYTITLSCDANGNLA